MQRRSVLIVLGILLVLAAAGAWWSRGMERIIVTGETTMDTSADEAVVVVAVQATAETEAAASAQVAQRLQLLRQALQAMGVASNDVIQLQQTTVPSYHYDADSQQQVLASAQVEQQVRIMVRSPLSAGAVMTAANSYGAQQVMGITLQLGDVGPRRTSAWQAALDDAQQFATTLTASHDKRSAYARTVVMREGERSWRFRSPQQALNNISTDAVAAGAEVAVTAEVIYILR